MTALPTIQTDVSLKPYNSFHVQANALYFCQITSVAALQALLHLCGSDPTYQHLPILVLGGGTNILLTQDFPGLVIHMAIKGIDIIDETTESVLIEAGAGETWHPLVLWALSQGYGGIENLSLIPGTVGAAPIQNIGAYGVELADCFVQLNAVCIKTGEIKVFQKHECEFGYRDSVFKKALKNQYIITQVRLLLNKKPHLNIDYAPLKAHLEKQQIKNPTIAAVSQAVIEIRQSKLPDPATIGNAGSFFKNPILSTVEFARLQTIAPDIPHFPMHTGSIKVPAAWLIEQCGWRGKSIGDIGVYTHQALVLVNYGNGSGADINALADQILQSVAKRFGIVLDMEVNIL